MVWVAKKFFLVAWRGAAVAKHDMHDKQQIIWKEFYCKKKENAARKHEAL